MKSLAEYSRTVYYLERGFINCCKAAVDIYCILHKTCIRYTSTLSDNWLGQNAVYRMPGYRHTVCARVYTRYVPGYVPGYVPRHMPGYTHSMYTVDHYIMVYTRVYTPAYTPAYTGYTHDVYTKSSVLTHFYIPLQRTTTNKLSVSKTTKAYSTLQHRWDYDPHKLILRRLLR